MGEEWACLSVFPDPESLAGSSLDEMQPLDALGVLRSCVTWLLRGRGMMMVFVAVRSDWLILHKVPRVLHVPFYLILFLEVGAVSVFLLQMRTQNLNYLPIVKY